MRHIPRLLHLLTHLWVFRFRKGVNAYWECCVCGKRSHTGSPHGYSALDRRWLNNHDGV